MPPRLEALGIVLGPYDPDQCDFTECRVSHAAMEVLDRYWFTWTWSLQPAD